MKEFNFCNNCGKHGHLFHQCKNPITSIGIIVFNNDEHDNTNSEDIKYLMIRRKDSLGYVDFMRGKYPLFNKRYLLNIIDEMTNTEKYNLLHKEFDELWKDLWGDFIGSQYMVEEKTSREKFNSLKIGISLSSDDYNLETLIGQCINHWTEPEWGFAQGRRNFQLLRNAGRTRQVRHLGSGLGAGVPVLSRGFRLGGHPRQQPYFRTGNRRCHHRHPRRR